MRKWLCMLVCCLSVYVQAQVWTLKEKEPTAPGTWWCFRNTVTLEELPRSLELRLAADTKYWLWVNGELQVSEGGLKRGPNPSDTYCDVITSLPALRAGENTVALLVWYFWKRWFQPSQFPYGRHQFLPFLRRQGSGTRCKMASEKASGLLCAARRTAQLSSGRVKHRVRCSERYPFHVARL